MFDPLEHNGANIYIVEDDVLIHKIYTNVISPFKVGDWITGTDGNVRRIRDLVWCGQFLTCLVIITSHKRNYTYSTQSFAF